MEIKYNPKDGVLLYFNEGELDEAVCVLQYLADCAVSFEGEQQIINVIDTITGHYN